MIREDHDRRRAEFLAERRFLLREAQRIAARIAELDDILTTVFPARAA